MKYAIWTTWMAFFLVLFTTWDSADVRSGPASGLTIGPCYRIFPSTTTQTETFIVPHPSDPNVLFASANTIDLNSGFISEGIYVTTNAGTSWFGSDTCKGSPITFHRGDPGITIDKNGTFILIRLGFAPGLYAHFSTDYGQSWSNQKTVATDDQDRAALTSDVYPASAHYGRSYAVWVKLAPPFPAVFSYTDDGGSTWTTSADINNPPQRCQGGDVTVASNGTVYACWASVISTSPFTEDYAGFGASTNGGTSWIVLENAFDMNGIAGLFPEKSNIRVNGLPRIDVDRSGGPRQGWIYIVTTEKNIAPAGSDPDIILHRSTDGGATWSGGIRVNQDTLNNGKFQYFPAIHVDATGAVNVLYYDDRETSSDSSGVYLSRSTDGGNSWADYRISDHHFKPLPIGGLGQGYQGDNIGLTSVGDTLWPVWMDNSTGIYQIWTCPVRISSLGTGVSDRPAPSDLRLHANYPNPFNGATTIEYDLRTAGHARLRVFNTLGQEVATLVNQWQRSGIHRVYFDPTAYGLSSGVYFFRLESGGLAVTRRMAYVK